MVKPMSVDTALYRQTSPLRPLLEARVAENVLQWAEQFDRPDTAMRFAIESIVRITWDTVQAPMRRWLWEELDR